MKEQKPVDQKPVETQVAAATNVNALSLLQTAEGVKDLLSKAPTAQKLQLLKKISEYIGAKTEDVNELLNVPFKIGGVLIHKATVNKSNDNEKQVDATTGEISSEPEYIEADRTVFKLENGTVLGFVSIAIANYVREFLIPAFGVGDWSDDDGKQLYIDVKVIQVSSRGGRTYSLQII